ncbi:putative cytoplasmic protein [Dethiosulfovibrio peptidovorans DSM 11002]|uniref:Cytoplasmic protein n=1 Tax=Dethiosulfovibrio peptidovorans DSM 11002 TaxID=469381 RepID=D2Z2B0_9BACT|nr:putative cytoplasmic protein [Dethiosulfovibrio peptidovorans DSM 11002]
MSVIKPCPFCWEKKVRPTQYETWNTGDKDRWWIVECPKCQTGGPIAASKKKAIELWNHREEEM